MRIILCLTLSFLTCELLLADTILQVQPVLIYKNTWKDDSPDLNFTSASSKEFVQPTHAGFSALSYYPGGTTWYKSKNSYNTFGTDNITITVLTRVSGKTGSCNLFSFGAGSHVGAGVRLGVTVTDSLIRPYVLFVARSSTEEAKKFVSVSSGAQLLINQDEWFVITISVNRTGQLRLYINGELSGEKSIKEFSDESLFDNMPQFATNYYKLNSKINPADAAKVDVAEIILRNELISSRKILAEARELLSAAGS